MTKNREVYYYPFGMYMPSRHVSGDVPQCTWATVTRMVGTLADQSLTETFPPMTAAKTIGGAKIYPDIDGINNYMDWTGGPTGVLTASFDNFDPSNPVTGITIPAATVREHEYRIDFTIDAVDAGALTARAIAYNDDHTSYEILSEMDVSASSDYSLDFTSTTDTTWLMIEGMNMQGGQSFRVTKATMQKYVYVPVTVFTQICDQGDDYRFGFNGQEKTNEIAGLGNHNTADFWEYDTRLGRRWNLDPVDQINVSNYAAFKNNPIVFIDPNGRNTVNSYDANTRTVTVNAKVYVQGKDIPQNTEKNPNARQDFIDNLNSQLKSDFKSTSVDVNGETYNVVYNVTAVLDPDNKKNKDNLAADENIMTINNKVNRPHVGGKDLEGNPMDINQGISNFWNDGSYASGMKVLTHEIGHMLGLDDRYQDYYNFSTKQLMSVTHSAYKNDKMGSSQKPLLQIHNEHLVKYSILRVVTQQKHMLEQYRSNSYKVNSIWDTNYDKSSVDPADVPKGFVPVQNGSIGANK